MEVLHGLRKLGISLLLDNFGTGYSSLSHLKRLPIDVLKIDRLFISKMTNDKQSMRIVSTIVELAKALGVEVVAEGIETSEQYQLLIKLGCRVGQGDLIAKPMTAKEVTEMLQLPGRILTHGKVRWWAKKLDALTETVGNITAQTGDISEPLVAVGTSITQHHGAVQNCYGVASAPAGPFRGKVATRPSMVEIADAILAAKPYDRTQIPKNYAGVDVSWPVIFSSIHADSVGTWYVTFDSTDAEYRSVSTKIDIEKYPKLKVIEHGHPAWIEGRILRADVRDIRLEDCAEITLE